MFANMLLEEEKVAFLRLLRYLSEVDGQVSKEEITFIQGIANELNIDASEIWADSELILEPILAQIITPLSRNIVIMELINLSTADEDYSIQEKESIENIARILNVRKSLINELENWVAEGKSWANKGLHIISSQGGE